MVRKIAVAAAMVVLAVSCSTFKPTPPSIYIEDMPVSYSSGMTLDQRLAAGDAWKSLRQGRTERASKLLEALPADNAARRVGLGYVELVMNDLQASERSFKDSLAAFPDMVPAYAGLAQVYEYLGKRDQAFIQYREIMKRAPDNKWAGGRLTSIRAELLSAAADEARAALAAGKTAEAKKACLKALFYDAGNADIHLQLARIYKKEKDPKNALLHLREALSGRPGDKTAMTDYAELLYDTENFSQSLDIYEKLAEADKTNQGYAARIAELKEKLGVFEVPSQYGKIAATEILTREDLAAILAVKFKGRLGTGPEKSTIIVDIAASWAQKLIVRVASYNIMKTYDNHTFQPRRIINRAELAETLSNLMDFLSAGGASFSPVIDPRRIKIADVPLESFYYQPVLRTVSCQVLELTPRSCFEPERTVSGLEAGRALDVIARLAE